MRAAIAALCYLKAHMRAIKISVLLRYYNCICKKLHIARSEMNEARTVQLKAIKMKLLFLEQPIYKEYAKYGFTTLVSN